jgi:hypothetical protein
MSKLRLFYVLSLVILGVLLVLTVFRPMVSGEKYSEVSQESIIQQKDRWIIQFNIINREGKEMGYVINWSTGEKTYSEKVALKDGRIFTYIHYVYPEAVQEGKVNLEIYKEGETTPFEQATYYIQSPGE